MKISRIEWTLLLPILSLTACAPGKVSGGIGCSKTSSVLKTPTIVKADSESAFDPKNKASAEEQRSLFYKHFGQFKSKTTGGYIYIQSRAANDVMGAVAADAPWFRCSVLLEFPKLTGEIRAPSIIGSPWYGKTESQIEADRFPARADSLKVRIYSAAHCFDYSVNDRVVLAPFSFTGQDLPAFNKAYTNIDVSIPELLAVQNLRKSLTEKVAAGAITNQNAIDILTAFQPATRNMRDVFGLPANGSTPSSPNAKQSCLIPPSDAGDAKQYTCATYHDMIVLDVEFNGLSAAQDTLLRDLRDKSVSQLKKNENDGPDLASATSAPIGSPWKDYATQPGFRMFLGDVLKSECTVWCMPGTPGETCYSSFDPSTNMISGSPYTLPAHCESNTFPADPADAYSPRVYTIKISCEGVAAPECDEVPINSIKNLHYMRYMTRERLRSFSRYNIVSSLTSIPSSLLSCSSSTTGLCSVKDEVTTALNAVAPSLTLTSTSLSASNFYSSSSPYVKAQKKVDGALAVWKDLFDSNSKANTETPDSGLTIINNATTMKKQLNPINFLDLHANFIVQDRALTTLPEPSDMTLRRAFLKLPINNIIGLNEFATFSMDSTADPRPIYIDSWSSSDDSDKGGRFLRFWTTKNQLNSFLDNFTLNSAFGDNFSQADPNSYVVIFDQQTVNPLTDFIAPIPTQATLQKGDSGSIFTLDGIPMFALSTVNGEPTSGGAAVAAIPVAAPDTDDVLPGGGSGGGAGGGGTVASRSGAACK